MCDERERLVDYLYNECEPAERRTVEQHLEACPTCRSEISELRAVRLDLLAWDVPQHESVWKPFAPARLKPWYREVPGWALAAAASLTFMLGMGGGIVSQSFLAPASPASSAAQRTATSVTPLISVNQANADVASMEMRILRAVDARLDARLQPMAAHVQLASTENDVDQLRREVRQQLQASEARYAEAFNRLRLNWLKDADRTYVSNSRFNQFTNEELGPAMRRTLVSFDPNRQD
jgi:negative regulator of sigma E activity